MQQPSANRFFSFRKACLLISQDVEQASKRSTAVTTEWKS